jgi:CoA:oxalate CoA-transferase
MNIFSGVRIIDLTRVFSGPFATRHFADFGAEVIKIEPVSGDDSRRFPPLIGNWSGYFEVLNRNKRSLFLDLKDENDLQTLYNLCANADVFVENFSPSVSQKLQIDYQTIKKIKKEIIYASICGVSEHLDRKYYDVIAQAESGLISLNGEKVDMKNATSIVDAFSGMKLAYAVSSALYYKEKTGKGQRIVVSMKGSAFDLLEQNLIETSITKKNPIKVGNMDNAIAPFGIFNAKDGSIVLAIGNESLWNTFTSFLLHYNSSYSNKLFRTNKERLENIDSLKLEIEKVFTLFPKENLIRELTKLGIPCGEVKTMRDVLEDKENYDEDLLYGYSVKGVGNVVSPVGGIVFSEGKFLKSKKAPVIRK